MVFEDSSQAKYFLFEDREALMSCKHRASVIRSLRTGCDIDRTKHPTKLIPQSFACGYHHRRWDGGSVDESLTTQHFDTTKNLSSPPRRMSTSDQEILIHFHAHQMHRLVGPSAIYPELRRSTSTLSTAVMLFRRFYLSNSVIDYPPRPIAAASALLAVKVDCEPSLPIRLLSYTTSVISHKARQGTSEFRHELRPVTVEEIEEAERNLMVGLDYRLRCHHPYGAIRIVAGEISAGSRGYTQQSLGDFSPRGVNFDCSDVGLDSLRDRATAVAQVALVYSDVHFLYPPGKIGFAAIAITLDGKLQSGVLGPRSRKYLRQRFPQKTYEEIFAFESDVVDIIREIDSCPEIDLAKFYCPMYKGLGRLAEQRVCEIRRAFWVAAYFHQLVNKKAKQDPPPPRVTTPTRSRKRKDTDTVSCYPHSVQMQFKGAKVTPTPGRIR